MKSEDKIAVVPRTYPRNGKAIKIAKIVLFLASDDACFINRTSLTADGAG